MKIAQGTNLQKIPTSRKKTTSLKKQPLEKNNLYKKNNICRHRLTFLPDFFVLSQIFQFLYPAFGCLESFGYLESFWVFGQHTSLEKYILSVPSDQLSPESVCPTTVIFSVFHFSFFIIFFVSCFFQF